MGLDELDREPAHQLVPPGGERVRHPKLDDLALLVELQVEPDAQVDVLVERVGRVAREERDDLVEQVDQLRVEGAIPARDVRRLLFEAQCTEQLMQGS